MPRQNSREQCQPELVAGNARRKGLYRCIEKTTLEEDAGRRGNLTTLRDVARNGIIARSMKGVVKALRRLIALHEDRKICIIRVKDRCEHPTAGGWADLNVNAVFLEEKLPKTVFEIQVIHKALMLVRAELGAHSEYNEFRAAAEITALIAASRRLASRSTCEVSI